MDTRSRTRSITTRNVVVRGRNRSTRRVKPSPSILERPLNPLAHEIVRLRKRIFMNQSVFAARLGWSVAFLRAVESGMQTLNKDDLGKLVDLVAQFCANADALKVTFTAQQLPVLDLLFVADHPMDFFALIGALERLNFMFSFDVLGTVLHELHVLGCISFEETTSRWTKRPMISQIQITQKGENFVGIWTEAQQRSNVKIPREVEDELIELRRRQLANLCAILVGWKRSFKKPRRLSETHLKKWYAAFCQKCNRQIEVMRKATQKADLLQEQKIA